MTDRENELAIARLQESFDACVALHSREDELTKEVMEEYKRAISLRLENMNEFRRQIEESEKQYLCRDVYDKYHDMLLARVEKLERSQWMIAGGLAVIVVLVEVLLRFGKA
jgi:hypothetical protein